MKITVGFSLKNKSKKKGWTRNEQNSSKIVFFFEKCEIKTKLSKKVILKKIDSWADPEYTDYYGSISEGGFFIAEKNRKYFTGGHIQNPFAPVATAKITESEGMTTVSMVIRMNLLVLILFAPIYIISLLTVVLFPFMLILLYYAFIKPAKRLKETIENLLISDSIY